MLLALWTEVPDETAADFLQVALDLRVSADELVFMRHGVSAMSGKWPSRKTVPVCLLDVFTH
jgi:hypothetical protein